MGEIFAKRRDERSRYLLAAQRKIDIARFHLEELSKALNRLSDPQELPPIPVQAHFEGVVVSIVAAEEKVKEAIRSAYGVDRKDHKKCRRLYFQLARKLPELGEWHGDPLLADLREVRNLAIHRHYEKRPITAGAVVLIWSVDKPATTRYAGSRELTEYCQAALASGATICDLIPRLEELLRNET